MVVEVSFILISGIKFEYAAMFCDINLPLIPYKDYFGCDVI